MQHYNYFRSGTSHRLRIALNLKGLPTTYQAVNLLAEAHQNPAFLALNPQGLVPALVLDDGQVLTQSPAIIEWLEERYPTPPLLPSGTEARAHVRALAALVGCDIHPINNRRILEYLRQHFGADQAAITAWASHWIGTGLDAYERLLQTQAPRGRYSWGDNPTLADVYLIPQVEGARRYHLDLQRWPRIQAIDAACQQLPAFAQASPWVQPDTPPRSVT